MKKLIGKLYEDVWRPYVGRPFTYVMREWRTQNKLLFTMLTCNYLAAVGFAMTVFFGWYALGLLVLGLAAAALWGHIAWDTRGKHIKHRKDFEIGNGSSSSS